MCQGVHVGILQAAQMVLIGAVGQVVGYQINAGHGLAVATENVRAQLRTEQSIGGRSRLRVVGTEEVVLLQILLDAHLYKHVVQRTSVQDEVVAQLGGPTRCGRQGQIFAVGRLVEQHGIDVTESVQEVQAFNGMHVEAQLKSP